MSNVVNLNKFRKARTRAVKDDTAAANRRKHGLTKAEKDKAKLDRDLERKRQDGHQIQGPGDPDDLDDLDDKDPA